MMRRLSSSDATAVKDKRPRRLSVGQGMQSELPESLGLKDLDILRVLGEGNYGRVKLVLHKETGFVLALKTMNKVSVCVCLCVLLVIHSNTHTLVLLFLLCIFNL